MKRDLFDFNGDGLPDLVVNGNDGADGTDPRCADATHKASCVDVYLNTGQGFVITSVVLPIPSSNYVRAQGCSAGMDTQQDVLDVNGDGLPDWVWSGTNIAGTTGWFVLLNLGGRLEPLVWSPWVVTPGIYYGEASRLWQGGTGAIRWNDMTHRTTVDMIDFNGDGMLDFVNTQTTPWSVQLATKWVNQQPKTAVRPNLLTSIDNGIGGTTKAFYKPSTLYDNTGGDGRPDLPFVTWVTSGIRQLDGQCTPAATSDYDALVPDPLVPGVTLYVPADNNCIESAHELAQSFQYQDGRFDAPSREFRGFRMVCRTDVDPTISCTTFGQDTYTKGKVLQTDTYAGSTASVQVVRRTSNGWNAAPFGTNRTQVWLLSSGVYDYDLNNGNAWSYAVTVNAQPDAFGNLGHSYRWGTTPEYLDTYTDYAAPTGASRVHDKPSHTYSTYLPQLGQSPQRFDEKWFYYDGGTEGGTLGTVDKGNVKVVESWLSGGTNPKVHMTYDNYGNITEVRDALDHKTATVYEAKSLYPTEVHRHVTESPLVELVTTTTTDYKWGKPLSVTGPNQALEVTQYGYDPAGHLTCVARPNDSVPGNCSVQYAYTYRSGGQLSSVAMSQKEPMQTTTYPNQISGYVTTTEYFDALGRHQHTAGLRVVSGTPPTPQTIISGRVEYDPVGHVAKRYDDYTMAPTSDALAPATPNNGFATFEYALNGSAYDDPVGRIHKVTQTDGTTRTTTYQGFTTTAFDEENHKTVTIGDHLGRTIEKDVYTGTGPSYVLYAWTTYTYDGAGRVLTSQQNSNTNTTITLSYDTLGRKTTMIDPDSGTWQYAYDAAGNVVIQQDPKAGQRVQFCYDGLNRLTRKLYLTDDILTPISCTNTAGIDWIEYLYDGGSYGKGHLTTVNDTHTDSTVNTAMTYDARGRVVSESKTINIISLSSKTATTGYVYDLSNADKVATINYPDGENVTTTYDQSGQPKSLASQTASYVSDLQYDLLGRPTTIVHANGTKDTRDYYGAPGSATFPYGHRLKVVKTDKTSTPTDTHLNLSYANYSPRGLLQQLTDLRNPTLNDGLSNSATLGYDDLGRLTSASYTYNASSYTYAYDALGNMTGKEGTTYTYGNAAKPHQVTVAGGVALSYDSNGNRQSKTGWTYGYDKDDRLSSINTSAVKFVYDYSGRRVAKVVGNSVTRYYNSLLEGTDGQLTKYYFIGGLGVAAQRINSSVYALASDAAVQVASTSGLRPVVVLLVRRDVQMGIALSVVVLGGGLVFAPWRRKRVVGIAVRHGQVIGVVLAFGLGTMPWPLLLRPLGPAMAEAQTPPLLVHFHADHLGSTQVITDSTGARLRQVRYRAYGDVRRFNGSGGTVTDCAADRYCHEFTGYDTEPISGLDYAGARFYDPALGLFLTHDPAAQFASPYSYGGGNPVSGRDPTGTVFGFDDLVVGLLVATFLATTIQSSLNGASLDIALTNGLRATGLAAVTIGTAAVLGPVVAGYSATLYFAASVALVGVGVYTTYESFRQGQYALGAVGAVTTALGIYGVVKSAPEVLGSPGSTSPSQQIGARSVAAPEPIEVGTGMSPESFLDQAEAKGLNLSTDQVAGLKNGDLKIGDVLRQLEPAANPVVQGETPAGRPYVADFAKAMAARPGLTPELADSVIDNPSALRFYDTRSGNLIFRDPGITHLGGTGLNVVCSPSGRVITGFPSSRLPMNSLIHLP